LLILTRPNNFIKKMKPLEKHQEND